MSKAALVLAGLPVFLVVAGLSSSASGQVIFEPVRYQYTINAAGGNQTFYMMDGFNMLRQYPTLKASAAYEIQTAGYGADNVMAPGGLVNLVSRSGSNKFELELNAMVPAAERGGLSLRLILHGRRVCEARAPKCDVCVLEDFCPSSRLPRKRSR